MLEFLNPSIAFDALRDFLAAGGNVLVLIMGTTFFMWALIIERLMYWSGAHGGVAKRAQRAWAARTDHKSWYAHAVRERLISEATQEASRFNNVIRALVAVTPLLRSAWHSNRHGRSVRRDGGDRFFKRQTDGFRDFQSNDPDDGRACRFAVGAHLHQHIRPECDEGDAPHL